MRYRLALFNKTNDLLTEITGFSKQEEFAHLDETSLKDIVAFTNSFFDEESLKEYIIGCRLLPEDKPISMKDTVFGINYYKNKDSEAKLLPYGVSFSPDKKYFDLDFLKKHFVTRLADKNFSKIFIEKYYSKLRDGIFSSSVLYDLSKISNYFQQTNQIAEEAAEKFSLAIQMYCQDKNGDGEYATSFSKLRELAMFAIDFERTYNPNNFFVPRDAEDQSLLALLEHYKAILAEGNITTEQKMVYEDEINQIIEQISSKCNNSLSLNRRLKNAFTRY